MNPNRYPFPFFFALNVDDYGGLVCDPAGPGFDGTNTSSPITAALNSQCIHTASGGYGTRERNCHQNWNMGNCGESQIGQRFVTTCRYFDALVYDSTYVSHE